MQILQWLCQRSHEQERKSTTKTEEFSDQDAEGKDIILVDHHELSHRTKRNEERKLGCNKNMKIFAFICRKDIPKACFYSSLNLKRLASFNRRLNLVYPMKMKRELSIGIGITTSKADSNEHLRNKVLDVTEASISDSDTKSYEKKAVPRMKELVKWVEKGGTFNVRKVAQLRRRGTVKAIDEDDKEAISGPITFSSATADQVTRRKGNWITSNSKFVVLEL